MFDPERVIAIDRLLSEFPGVTREFVEISQDVRSGKKVDATRWKSLRAYLEATDRAKEELSVLDELARKVKAGEKVGSDELAIVLNLVVKAQQDLRAILSSAFGEPASSGEKYRELEEEAVKYLSSTPPAEKATRLKVVQDFIYKTPGNYIQQLFFRLTDQHKIQMSYGTLRAYIKELEAKNLVLTIGRHQGIPRYCFPHPSRIKDRSKYFGDPFPVFGTVESNLTNRFEALGQFREVFLVNHAMKPVLLVTPIGWKLASHQDVEGFGELRPFSFLSSKLRLETTSDVSRAAKEVVIAKQLITRGQNPHVYTAEDVPRASLLPPGSAN